MSVGKYWCLTSFLKNDSHEARMTISSRLFLPVNQMEFSSVSQNGQIPTVSQGLALVFPLPTPTTREPQCGVWPVTVDLNYKVLGAEIIQAEENASQKV